jgi:hypothetical protein
MSLQDNWNQLEPEKQELGCWTGIVIVFFTCLGVAAGLADSESEILEKVAMCCMFVSFALAFPLYQRFHWFRVFIWVIFAFILMNMLASKKEEEDAKNKR